MKNKGKIIALLIIIGIASVFGVIYLPILVDSLGPSPKFVSHDWIELEKIGNISKYHSTIGHGYPGDDNPTSDKHYFYQYDCFTNTTLNMKTFAPVDAIVISIKPETHVLSNGEIQGKQIHLKSIEHPSIVFRIFHQNIETTGLQMWQILNAGDQVGYCDLRECVNIDIAVFRGFSTISWFEVLNPSVMATYESRGITLDNIIKTTEQIAQSQADGYNFSNYDPSDIINLFGTNPCP